MKLPVKNIYSLHLAVLLSAFVFSCSKSTDDSTPGKNEVFMRSTAFTPSSLTVVKGTTVKWTNKDNLTHTVTSDNGLFDSGNKNLGETFSHLFDSIGTFNYHCTTHSGMTGTVIVTSPPLTADVTISSSYFSPATINVAKGATVTWTNNDDLSHTVTSNSSIFNSGTLIKNQTFSYTFNNIGSFPYHCSIHTGMTGTVIVN